MRYADRADKLAYARLLAREAAVPETLVAFALCGPQGESYTPGANRNALSLDTLGEGVVWADDDTVADLARVAGASSTARFGGDGGSLIELWYGDQPVAVEPTCPFREHARWLGAPLGALIDSDAQLGSLSPGLLEAILRGDARVSATWFGLRGDSGSDDPSSYIYVHGASRQRLLSNRKSYERAVRSRRLTKAVLAPTFAEGIFLQTTAVGLDQRELLPPFQPMFRGEDVVFPPVLRAMRPELTLAYLPWTVLHEPQEARSLAKDALNKAALETCFYQLVLFIVRAEPPSLSPHPAARLKALGELLRHYADASPSEFAERVRTTFWRSTELALERHEKLLEHYRSLPAFWAADIRNMADALQRRALKDDSVAFREYQKSPDLLAAVECARADLARLGELFVAWPALWEAAALLRARGVRLSRAL